jgi:hypothetical protein
MHRRGFMGGLAASAVLPVLSGVAHGSPVSSQGDSLPEPGRDIQGPAATPNSHPVLLSAAYQYVTMKKTRYQHKDIEIPAQGLYFYDCVGFVSYALKLAAPRAHASLFRTQDIPTGYVPSPGEYCDFIAALDRHPDSNWERVARVEDIRPGDILAWTYESHNPKGQGGTDGHSCIAAGPPLALAGGSFALLVYDSTATPHGPFDTRRTNPKNQPLKIDNSSNFGKPSGLGRGTIQIFVDENTGGPSGMAWTVATKRATTDMEIGRALA